MKIKSLTIYCSSSKKLDVEFYNLATEIGVFLSQIGISIVYGGGNIGLMGELSNAAIKNGGHVTGIIPEFLKKGENLNLNISNTIIVKTMSERKNLLFEKGDGFLILPGGSGTIEEAAEIISWKILGLHTKPIIIFNFKNYWKSLYELYNDSKKKNFSNKNLQNISTNVNTISEFKNLF